MPFDERDSDDDLPFGYYLPPIGLEGQPDEAGVIEDQHEVRIAAGLTSHEGREAFAVGFRTAHGLARAVGERPRWAGRTHLSGVEASEFLGVCIDAVETHARTWARQSYGQYRWLWCLRRVPTEMLAGGVSGTSDYRLAVAEALAIRGAPVSPPKTAVDRAGRFPLDHSAIRRIAWLVGFAHATAQLHVRFRLCGKGAQVDVKSPITLGRALPPDDPRAVSEYDLRASLGSLETTLGAAVLERFDGAQSSSRSAVILFVRAPGNRVQLLQDRSDSSRRVYAIPRFSPFIIDTTRLEQLLNTPCLQDASLWSPEVADLLCVLSLGMFLTGESVESFANAIQVGYVVVEKHSLVRLWSDFGELILQDLTQRFPAISAHLPTDLTHLLSRCLAMPTSSWPMLGTPPVFHASYTQWGVDLAAATQRLIKVLEYPREGGQVANLRAGLLESHVQAIIDRTRWAPDPSVRTVLERTSLRLNGRAIGDIDAMACSGARTLIVSCKSILYSRAYDCGEFAAVRNAEDKVAAAVAQWDRFLDLLRANPVGDNYDVRPLGELIGVVVTPHILFVRSPLLDRETLPGLRYYSSVAELERWLSHPENVPA